MVDYMKKRKGSFIILAICLKIWYKFIKRLNSFANVSLHS